MLACDYRKRNRHCPHKNSLPSILVLSPPPSPPSPSPRLPRPSPRAPRVPRGRAHRPCGLAVGRDVLIAPPRHRRGARLGIVRRCAVPWCGPVAVGRDAWPPGLPARAAAPHRPRWLTAAVRGLASRTIAAPPGSRRSTRGVRGAIPVDVRRSPSPPSPSRAAWHPAKFARALPTRITRAARWSAAEPPGSRRRTIGAVRGLGIVHTLRVLHAAALSAARCEAGPRTRRDVIIAPPLRTQYSHAWGARALPRRRDGRIRRHPYCRTESALTRKNL